MLMFTTTSVRYKFYIKLNKFINNEEIVWKSLCCREQLYNKMFRIIYFISFSWTYSMFSGRYKVNVEQTWNKHWGWTNKRTDRRADISKNSWRKSSQEATVVILMPKQVIFLLASSCRNPACLGCCLISKERMCPSPRHI